MTTKSFYLRHRDELLAKSKIYYQRDKGKRKQKRLELKKEVLTHYGIGKCACIKCGEDRIACLSLDHIIAQRRKIGGKNTLNGRKIYFMLKQQNYPIGFQTLCMNCQWIKRDENNEFSSISN